jgi:3-deoxy-7-phosphoheptulonate synthase
METRPIAASTDLKDGAFPRTVEYVDDCNSTRSTWAPDSWQRKRATQQPVYRDCAGLEKVVAQLEKLPPLVTSWEVETLKAQLAEAARGERFLLQGGDCAESFEECQPQAIVNKLKILLQMSLIVIHGSKKPVTRVGRFAGQYAKPRSAETETRGGITLPTYRGDMINRPGFTEADRSPDPMLLLRAYERAALTMNFIRSLTIGGFADLHHPENWDLGFTCHSPLADEWKRVTHSIGESIHFTEALSGATIAELSHVDFFTSHEGLHLLYEQAQTRSVPRRVGVYNLSTHFPWIGNRTRSLDGAHVEYFRGIANPIAVKIGPDVTSNELLALIDILNPENEPGRLSLIHRFGAEKISDSLPPLLHAVQEAKRVVLWCCDPMHGNTKMTGAGIKTRYFQDIREELERAFHIHQAEGTYLSGLHIELTGENVTECIGGPRELRETDLDRTYTTLCDPRLNYEQALEMAMLLSRLIPCRERP